MFRRKINLFEKLLLPLGTGLTFFGFYLIILANQNDSLIVWAKLTALFSWMILLFVVVISATSENMKEELILIQKENMVEVKLMREIIHDQLQELKLLRHDKKSKK